MHFGLPRPCAPRYPACMKKLLQVALAFLVASSLGCLGGKSGDDPVDADLTIGLLVDQSNSQLDQYIQAAAELSAQNASGLGVTVAIVAKNTEGDATIAAQALQELLDQGIKVVVGPTTSGEAQGALPLANAAGALLVSPASTAQTLAIAGDALYRLSPANTLFSQVTVDLVETLGFSSIVTVNNDDLGDSEEASEFRRLAASSGISLQPPIVYSNNSDANFSAVSAQVASAVAAAGGSPSAVAVAVFGGSEVADLLSDCATIASLDGITFLGSDGTSLNSEIVNSAAPAFFAVQAGAFPSAILSVPPDQQAAADTITNAVGAPYANAFVLNGYDAVSIMVDAYIQDSNFASGGAQARAAFAAQADGYPGLTGLINLNQAGDRITGHYTFWGVCSQQGLINWFNVGGWSPRSPGATSGTATFTGCPSQ